MSTLLVNPVTRVVSTRPVYLRRAARARAQAPRAGRRAGRGWARAAAAAGSACGARRARCSRAPLPTPLCPSATSPTQPVAVRVTLPYLPLISNTRTDNCL